MKLSEDSLIILENKADLLGAVYLWSCISRQAGGLHGPKAEPEECVAVPGLREDVQLVKNEMLKAPRGQ